MDLPDHLAVPLTWAHVDLQRLRSRLEAHNTSERVLDLKMYQAAISLQVANFEKSTSRRQKRLERLREELASLTAEQEEEVELQEVGRRISDGTRNQAYYQKSTSRTYFVPTTTPATTAPPCPLSLYGFDPLQDCSVGAAEPAEESVGAFLKFCAPLFQWSADDRVVKAPFFFDEPCLLERVELEEASRVAASASPPPTNATAASPLETFSSPPPLECQNAACAYWHRDQLRHMRLVVQFLCASFDEICVRDEQLCCVRRLLSCLLRRVECADSVTLVCALVCEALQRLIGQGLHEPLVRGKKPKAALAAPLIQNDKLTRADVVRRALGLQPPGKARERLEQLLKHSVEESPAKSLSAVAAEGFEQHRDALSWRCLLACVEDVGERRWLARQGVQLFPRCPQLHLALLLSSIHSASSVSDVVDTCVSSCRALSAQAAASVVAGLDGGQYGTIIARHVGYMVAVTFVHCAKTDAGRALDFIAPLLSTDAETGLAALLLPVARQNLTLMTVALRRVGHLRGVAHLPLAAVSDHVFALSDPEGSNPADSGRDAVYAAFQLLQAFKRDHFDPCLTSACAGALQLSLLRTFAHRLPYLERVTEKTAPESPQAQSVVYSAYVETVAQQQCVPAATAAATALAGAEGASCVLTLRLAARLRAWGGAALPVTAAAVTAFCSAAGLPVEALDSGAAVAAVAATHTGVSAVEWVAAYALRWHALACERENEEQDDVWAALLAFPVAVLATSTEAAALYFSLLLQVSAAPVNPRRFRVAVHRCLSHFREVHARAWDPLDSAYASLVGLPHYVGLLIYQNVPQLLGAAAQATEEWRCVVLATASDLNVLHPLLLDDTVTL